MAEVSKSLTGSFGKITRNGVLNYTTIDISNHVHNFSPFLPFRLKLGIVFRLTHLSSPQVLTREPEGKVGNSNEGEPISSIYITSCSFYI